MTATIAGTSTPAIAHRQLLIDNEWIDSLSGKTFATLNPATGERIGTLAEAGAADVDRAVRAARKAFEKGEWAKMSARRRGRLLFALAEAIELHSEELAELEVSITASLSASHLMQTFR